MNKHVSIFSQLKQDRKEIVEYLKQMNYKFESLPPQLPSESESGEAFALAYPIQGLLKYHGMWDSNQKISMFPSISLNNGAFQTITYVNFNPQLKKDRFVLNGTEQKSNTQYQRVFAQLHQIRKYAKIHTRALIISRNITSHDFQSFHAKGLGTSASGGAAIARAAFNILYDTEKITQNSRLFSIFSRYLSGSASRSSVGGVGLWLSHPECDSKDSFALRLDGKDDIQFIRNISLLTIPLQSSNTTSNAHEIALKSPLYPEWCLSRKEKIIQFLIAFQKHDFQTIGKLTEEDSKLLHKIHTSVPQMQPYWSKKTEKIMKLTYSLRDKDIPIYFSIDTGPSVVLLAQNEFVNEIFEYIQNNISSTMQIVKGKIQGQSKLMCSNSKLYHILDDDIAKFQN